MAEDRRLNVAVTRAKRHLSLICNTRTLQQNVFLKNFVTYFTENAAIMSPEDMEEDNCIKLSADFSQIDLSAIADETKTKSKMPQKTEEEIAEEQKARKDKKIKRLTAELEKFIDSTSHRYHFSSKLSCFDRMLVHDLAKSFHLDHYSVGEGSRRRIIVAKPNADSSRCSSGDGCSSAPRSSDYSSDSSNHSSQYDMKSDSSSSRESSRSRRHGAEKLNSLERKNSTRHCTICGKNVPSNNYISHRLACEKSERTAIAQQQSKLDAKKREADVQIVDSKSKKSRKSNKERQKGAAKKKELEDDDDFDSIVSAFADKNKRCNLKGCKDTNSLMLQICNFCHSCFCLKHFIPEVHGCGRDAHQQARAVSINSSIIFLFS